MISAWFHLVENSKYFNFAYNFVPFIWFLYPTECVKQKVSYCETQEFAFKKMGVEFQSYVILKRLKLEVSAWSRFVEFLKLFKMLMALKWKICVVFSQSWKTKRPVFFLATVI